MIFSIKIYLTQTYKQRFCVLIKYDKVDNNGVTLAYNHSQ